MCLLTGELPGNGKTAVLGGCRIKVRKDTALKNVPISFVLNGTADHWGTEINKVQ